MLTRPEQVNDIASIHRVNTEAFDTEAEANLVDALRYSGVALISLVAEQDGQIIGHILFSPVSLAESDAAPAIAGLAPMAVRPDWQNKGIGSKLVQAGLHACVAAGYEAVVVLGHPNYYPRFGFAPATNVGLKSEYDVPPEVFMVKELKPSALRGIEGTIKYHSAFNQL